VNEVSFRHPWDEIRIADVADVIVGGTPSTLVDRYWGGSVRWMASGDVHLKRIVDVSGRISHEGLNASNAKIVEPPAVAIALAGQGKTRGTAAIVLVALCTNQSVALIKPRTQRLDAAYLYHCLEFRYEELRSRSAGAGRAGLSKGLIEAIPVPLPEERVQRKIAEILDNVDRVVGQTESLIAKYQRAKTGLMQDLLTRGIDEHGQVRTPSTHKFMKCEIGTFPDCWEVVAIEKKLADIIDYRGRTPKKVEAGVPLITAKNVRDGFLSPEPREFIAVDDYTEWMTRGIPSLSDVLFTTEAPMGNVARVPDFRIALAQRVLTLVPNREELDPDYLFWLLHWPRARERIEILTTGSTVVGVKQSVFRKVIFQFPPLPEQQRMAEVLNSMAASLADMQEMLPKLSGLKTSLMQDLLTGRVPVNSLVQAEVATAMP